jgi:O-antigen/teichoic acid export membrane protein
MSLILPLAVFLFFAVPDIVYGLLGKKWKDSILPLKMLSIVGFLTAFDTMSTPLFISVGNPNIEFLKNLLKASIMAISIYPLTSYGGLLGTCMSLIISSIAILPIWAKAKSIANLKWQDVFLRLFSPFVLGVTTALSIILTHTFIIRHGIQSLMIAIISSGAFYISATIIIGRVFNRGIFVYIPRILKNI